jgi:hypothetical protein
MLHAERIDIGIIDIVTPGNEVEIVGVKPNAQISFNGAYFSHECALQTILVEQNASFLRIMICLLV